MSVNSRMSSDKAGLLRDVLPCMRFEPSTLVALHAASRLNDQAAMTNAYVVFVLATSSAKICAESFRCPLIVLNAWHVFHFLKSDTG